MPGYTTEIRPNPKRPAVARATLRTPGDWSTLSPWEKDAWNEATRAIDKLMKLYEIGADSA